MDPMCNASFNHVFKHNPDAFKMIFEYFGQLVGIPFFPVDADSVEYLGEVSISPISPHQKHGAGTLRPGCIGKTKKLILHLEVQRKSDPDFDQRILAYQHALATRFSKLKVLTIAISERFSHLKHEIPVIVDEHVLLGKKDHTVKHHPESMRVSEKWSRQTPSIKESGSIMGNLQRPLQERFFDSLAPVIIYGQYKFLGEPLYPTLGYSPAERFLHYLGNYLSFDHKIANELPLILLFRKNLCQSDFEELTDTVAKILRATNNEVTNGTESELAMVRAIVLNLAKTHKNSLISSYDGTEPLWQNVMKALQKRVFGHGSVSPVI